MVAATIRMSTRCVPLAADPLDREILNGPEQLGLRRQRQVRYFVEEQRAAVGRLELAASSADAGGRALLDAEQFGLEQCFDQRGAIDGDERAVAPPAQLVNLACDQFLADAALAFEENVKSVHATRSIVARSRRIAPVDPIRGAAMSSPLRRSRRSGVPGDAEAGGVLMKRFRERSASCRTKLDAMAIGS